MAVHKAPSPSSTSKLAHLAKNVSAQPEIAGRSPAARLPDVNKPPANEIRHSAPTTTTTPNIRNIATPGLVTGQKAGPLPNSPSTRNASTISGPQTIASPPYDIHPLGDSFGPLQVGMVGPFIMKALAAADKLRILHNQPLAAHWGQRLMDYILQARLQRQVTEVVESSRALMRHYLRQLHASGNYIHRVKRDTGFVHDKDLGGVRAALNRARLPCRAWEARELRYNQAEVLLKVLRGHSGMLLKPALKELVIKMLKNPEDIHAENVVEQALRNV